jgi:putative PIN family toxin of toxin-antitoxin system
VRVCLDSNVLISALGTRGLASDVLRLVLAEHELVVPEVVVNEVTRNLVKKFDLPEDTVTAIEQLLRKQILVPKPPSTGDISVRDAPDAWVLASALAGKAELVVTGDAELVAMKSPPLPILTPRAFWERLRSGGA